MEKRKQFTRWVIIIIKREKKVKGWSERFENLPLEGAEVRKSATRGQQLFTWTGWPDGELPRGPSWRPGGPNRPPKVAEPEKTNRCEKIPFEKSCSFFSETLTNFERVSWLYEADIKIINFSISDLSKVFSAQLFYLSTCINVIY